LKARFSGKSGNRTVRVCVQYPSVLHGILCSSKRLSGQLAVDLVDLGAEIGKDE